MEGFVGSANDVHDDSCAARKEDHLAVVRQACFRATCGSRLLGNTCGEEVLVGTALSSILGVGWMAQHWCVQRCVGRTHSPSKDQNIRRTPCTCCIHPSEKKLPFLVRSCQGLQGDGIQPPVFPRDTVGCEPENVPFKRERSKRRMGTNRHPRDSAAGWRSTMERRVADSTRE